MKNTEIKKGTILYANTGVAVKVLKYDSKFGGRILVERADGIKGGKPLWRPLSKFSKTNPYPQKKKGGGISNDEIQIEDKVKIIKNIEDHEGYKKDQVVEVIGADDDNYFHVEGSNGTQWYVGEEEIELVKKGSGKYETEILKQSIKAKKNLEVIRQQTQNKKLAKGSTIRANKSSLLKYVNFEDNWHINLLELNPNRNNNGLKYKNKNQYAVVRSTKEKGQEIFEFKTLSEAEERFEKLVEKSKTYSKVVSEGKTNNYEKGGSMPKSFEYSIGGL